MEERSNENGSLVLDTYYESEIFKFLYIYDYDYLDKAFDYKKEDITANKIIELVNSSSKISNKYKTLLITYINNLFREYPNVDARVMYENLKTLEVVECTKNELMIKKYFC